GASAPAKPWPNDASPAGNTAPGTPPMMDAPRPGSGARPCMAELTRLRQEVERKGQAAKGASQRHAAGMERRERIAAYAAAEEKWVIYAESNLQSCSFPFQIVNELKQVHANTEQTRDKICTVVLAAPGNAARLPREHVDNDLARLPRGRL